MIITSVQNPRIKQLVRLKDRRDRDETDLFLIEGYRELLRAQEAGVPIETLYICPELFLGTNERQLIHACNTTVIECDPHVFKKISYRDRPDGLIAVAPQMHKNLNDLNLSANPLLVIAEAIEKPGNLGTILRSSDAVGVDAVVVCDRCTDIHNPNVVRASVGTLFTIPVLEAGGEETLKWLKDRGIKVVAATPAAQHNYTEVDLTGPVAIAVGTEQLGLSPLWMQQADIQVRIPMRGVADSLNVSIATSLLLYETLRQRS